MRTAGGTRLLLAAAAATCLVAGEPAFAFHSGGVGECDGCHTMHNSLGGNPATARMAPGSAPSYLLKANDASSVCLNCHQARDTGPNGYHVATDDADMPPGRPPLQLTPGGDFAWLKKGYSWTPATGGALQHSPGDRHGHNVVAAEYGYFTDAKNLVAPGGTYPANLLSCTSCHDPHGSYRRLADGSVASRGLPIFGSGSQADGVVPIAGISAVGAYRMLGGSGYQPRWLSGAFAFANPPPAAVAPADYNRSEQTAQTRVAYGSGMSEWCANCHAGILVGGVTTGMSDLRHPAGSTATLTSTMLMNYAAYVSTGKLTGSPSSSYLSLVPFEEGTTDYPTLRSHARSDNTYLQGPDARSTVSCITCHRAHASGFDGIARFASVGNDFITLADAAKNARWPDAALDGALARGRTAAETQQAYYGRPAWTFSGYQRPLCNKCHVKD